MRGIKGVRLRPRGLKPEGLINNPVYTRRITADRV